MISVMRILLCTIIAFLAMTTNAQSLRGRVIDEKGTPIGMVSVYLSVDSTASTLISSCVSDSLGYFILDWRNYSKGYLNASHVGYNSSQYEIKRESQGDYIEVLLHPKTTQLDQVVVLGDQSSVISTKNGVKIYRLSNNASMMKNVYSSLQEIPDLTINVAEQKINLVEGGEPIILINGIYTGRDLMSLSSSDIAKIEIRNTVPQEYKHLGYSCVLNIHTKVTKSKNYTANFGVYTHPRVYFGIADLSTTMETKRYSLFGTVRSFGFLDNKSDVSENVSGNLYHLTQNSQRLSDYKNLSIAVGGHIKWDENAITSIGLVYSTKPQQYRSENKSDILYFENQTYSHNYDRSYSDCLNGYTVNLYHSHLIKNIGRLSLHGSLYNGTNKNNTTNTLYNSPLNETRVQKQELQGSFREYNAGVKYNNSLWGGNLVIGNSVQWRNNQIARNKEQVSSSQLKNYSYVEYSKQIGKLDFLCSLGWDIFVSHFNNEYLATKTFLPIFNLSYKEGRNTLKILYQKDYSIPSVAQLSPINSSYLSTERIYGNPSLVPEISHIINLSYEFTRKPYYWQVYVKRNLIQNKVFRFSKPSESIHTIISFANAKSLFRVTDLGSVLRLKYQKAMLSLHGGYRMTRFLNSTEYNLFGGMQVNYSWQNLHTSLSISLPHISRGIDTYQKSSPESQLNLTYSINNLVDINLGVRYILSKKSFEKIEHSENYSYHYLNQFLNRGNIILLGFRIKLSSSKKEANIDSNIIREQERSRILSD